MPFPDKTILERWQITAEDFTELIDQNPSLRGMISGYLAEFKLKQFLLSVSGVERVTKNDDHDRTKKGDFIVTYKGHDITIEVKSLQTNSIVKTATHYTGKAQCDASDRREITLPNGTTVQTTCLLVGEFDLLAVNLFAFENNWRFVFARNEDLPRSTYKKYAPEQRQHLLASLVKVSLPSEPPFQTDIVSLLNAIVQERAG